MSEYSAEFIGPVSAFVIISDRYNYYLLDPATVEDMWLQAESGFELIIKIYGHETFQRYYWDTAEDCLQAYFEIAEART